jgi:hypothetical protein
VTFITWINSLALLILNLSLIAWAKLRWPDSFVGKIASTIA